MKKILMSFALMMLLSVETQAAGFTPDPKDFEYIGMTSEKCGYFYNIPTAKADGVKADVWTIQANPKNRTVRWYRSIIDPDTMTIKGAECRLYDYRGVLLDSFILPSAQEKYEKGGLVDKMYASLLEKGIVKKPVAPAPAPVIKYVYETNSNEQDDDGDVVTPYYNPRAGVENDTDTIASSSGGSNDGNLASSY